MGNHFPHDRSKINCLCLFFVASLSYIIIFSYFVAPGSSSDPCDDAYRGPHAFSEIETKNLADYLKRLGSRLKGYMDIHAYSQLWMIPWGYTKVPTKDHDELVGAHVHLIYLCYS